MTRYEKELKEARDIQHALNAVKIAEPRVLHRVDRDEGYFIEAAREYKLAVQYLNELTK